jgi:acetyltransferase
VKRPGIGIGTDFSLLLTGKATRHALAMSKPPDYTDFLDIDGTRITIRTMHPEDRDIEEQFVRRLTPASKYNRFHTALRELTEYMLDHFTNVDYPDEMALIATIRDGDAEREIGVARYVRTQAPDTAEIAVVVSDEWQGKGIGGKLLKDLRDLAHQAGIKHLEARVLPDNRRMLELAQDLGFRLKPRGEDFSAVELGKDVD